MRLVKLITLASLALMFSCGSNNTPEKTIEEFFLAVKENNFDKAKEYVTEDSRKAMDMLGDNLQVSLGGTELNSVDCVTENTSSNCDCFLEGKDTPLPASLVKNNGKWEIDLKASVMSGFDNLLDGLKDIDLNGLINKLGEGIGESSEGLNDLIKSIDPETVKEFTEGLDSNLDKLGESIEELTKHLEKNQESK